MGSYIKQRRASPAHPTDHCGATVACQDETSKDTAQPQQQIGITALPSWWLRRLRVGCTEGLALWWEEPEWPLLLVAALLFASFLLHWLGYRLALHQLGFSTPFFAPTQWEGRTGWRKPMVFGISNAMVFCSLWHALRSQRLLPRGPVAHVTAWSTAAEVGIITLQAWRGRASHFNTDTELDAALYVAKLCGVAVLGMSCFAITFGFFRRPGLIAEGKQVALTHGLLQLCVSVIVGILQVVYGHTRSQASAEEDKMCLFATAGAHRSPCYEIHGQAIVKLAHFMPLHVTEVLLVLAWAAAQTHAEAWPAGVKAAAYAHWLLTAVSLWQTLAGRYIMDHNVISFAGMASGLILIIAAFIWAALAPLRVGGKDGA